MPDRKKQQKNLEKDIKLVKELTKRFKKLNEEIKEFMQNMEEVKPYMNEEETEEEKYFLYDTDFVDDVSTINLEDDEEEKSMQPIKKIKSNKFNMTSSAPRQIGPDTFIRTGPIFLPWACNSINDLF